MSSSKACLWFTLKIYTLTPWLLSGKTNCVFSQEEEICGEENCFWSIWRCSWEFSFPSRGKQSVSTFTFAALPDRHLASTGRKYFWPCAQYFIIFLGSNIFLWHKSTLLLINFLLWTTWGSFWDQSRRSVVGGILVSSCPVSWCLLVTPKSDTSDGKPTLLTATATLYLSILFCFFAIAACSLSALHCHKIRFKLMAASDDNDDDIEAAFHGKGWWIWWAGRVILFCLRVMWLQYVGCVLTCNVAPIFDV